MYRVLSLGLFIFSLIITVLSIPHYVLVIFPTFGLLALFSLWCYIAIGKAANNKIIADQKGLILEDISPKKIYWHQIKNIELKKRKQIKAPTMYFLVIEAQETESLHHLFYGNNSYKKTKVVNEALFGGAFFTSLSGYKQRPSKIFKTLQTYLKKNQ